MNLKLAVLPLTLIMLAIASVLSAADSTTIRHASDTSSAQHVHFAYGFDSSSEMIVSWLSRGAAYQGAPVVKIGTSPGVYPQTFSGFQSTYNASIAQFSMVNISALNPDTKYFFVAGDGALPISSLSGPYSFRTAQKTLQRPVSIAMFGDLGVKNSMHVVPDLTQLASSGKIDFIYHVGDISYADDVEDSEFENQWELFMTEMDKIFESVPYMVCPGNHEADGGYDNPTSPFAAYSYRFNMPSAINSPNPNMWFSFNFADLIHFVSINTETDFPNAPEGSNVFGGAQLAWLEQDLKTAKEQGYKFIIAVGHRPIYSSAQGYEANGVPINECAALQNAIEGLFLKYSVDLFVVGHQHAYERMFPTFNSTKVTDSYIDPSAPVHVISGSAGCEEGIAANWESKPEWLAHRYPETASILNPGWGYGILHVLNTTTLHWQFLRSDNALEDEFVLIKH